MKDYLNKLQLQATSVFGCNEILSIARLRFCKSLRIKLERKSISYRKKRRSFKPVTVQKLHHHNSDPGTAPLWQGCTKYNIIRSPLLLLHFTSGFLRPHPHDQATPRSMLVNCVSFKLNYIETLPPYSAQTHRKTLGLPPFAPCATALSDARSLIKYRAHSLNFNQLRQITIQL